MVSHWRNAEHFQSNYIINVATVLRLAQALQSSHFDALKSQVSVVDAAISSVDPKKDQELFIEHNLRPFGSPTDWSFEPCSSYYDTVSGMDLLVWLSA
jgi:hypothetical protein